MTFGVASALARAATPSPPYFAAIFVARLRSDEPDGQDHPVSDLMARTCALRGFLGEDTLRMPGHQLISVSYWREAEEASRGNRDDSLVGDSSTYEFWELQIARVEAVASYRGRHEELLETGQRMPGLY